MLAEDAILFPQIVDQVFLLAIQPTRHGKDEELQSMRHSASVRASEQSRRASFQDSTASGRFLAPYGVIGPDGNALTYTFGDHQIFDHPEMLGLGTRCIYAASRTVPMLPAPYNNFYKIIQTENHVVIQVEQMHWARVIRLDSEGRPVEHAPPRVRSLSGDSIGWWEGDTLVVDTTNFLRSWDTPHEGLHVVERFTRQDDGTLFYEFRIDDPDYAAPYGGSLPMPLSDELIYEVACHEGNYSMRGTLLGARMLEEQWYKKHGR